MKNELLKQIPSIDNLLNNETIISLYEKIHRNYAKILTQNYLQRLKKIIEERPDEAQSLINNLVPSLYQYINTFAEEIYRKVINATGIILHTNLGRAPLCEAAIKRLSSIADSYITLEYDLEEGARGKRDERLQEIFYLLIGSPATIIVNNNAAAMLLILNTLAAGKEVIVSRGELIEIGASFRLPEIFQKSGAILKEVGTTNKTKISDYEKAFSENTEAILRVHPSNYKIIGFTERPSLEELISLAKKNGYYLIKDLGSGYIFKIDELNLQKEPNAKEALEKGVDIICFSGDKILGGPQCGIICGKENLIEKIRNNPLFRALRVDKLTLISLEATLRCYLRGNQLKEVEPLKMLSAWLAELRIRAQRFRRAYMIKVKKMNVSSLIDLKLQSIISYIGGGFAPAEEIESYGISIRSEKLSPQHIHSFLRLYETPIIARIEKDSVILDFRTIKEKEEKIILKALIEMNLSE